MLKIYCMMPNMEVSVPIFIEAGQKIIFLLLICFRFAMHHNIYLRIKMLSPVAGAGKETFLIVSGASLMKNDTREQ